MKKILLTLVLLVGVVFGLFAQNLTYQAVIRDNSQQLVVNTPVKATVTISFTTGTPPTYEETVVGSTNLHGLLSIEFGGAALLGRDFEGATITTTVKSADESVVYVNNLERPVSAVPYALSVNGQSIQNYLTEHNYVNLTKLNDTLNAYSTTAAMDARHYLTSDSAVIGNMRGDITTNANSIADLTLHTAKNAIRDSVAGQIHDSIVNIAAKSHTHSNKDLLDTYNQTNTDLTDAVAKKHEHANAEILNNTTATYTNDDSTKLDGIAEGAEVNVQSDWSQADNSKDDFIKNKPSIKDTVNNILTTGQYVTSSSLETMLQEIEARLTDKIDSLTQLVDSLSKLPHGGGDTPDTPDTPTEVADGQPCPGAAKVQDADGNEYNTVKIGTQCWTKENLKTTTTIGNTYNPGPNRNSTNEQNASNVATYGLLYDWTAVMQGASSSDSVPSGVQGICPAGWHVPSAAEWDTLTKYTFENYVCGDNCGSWAAGTNVRCIANALSSTTDWVSNNTEGCKAGNTGNMSNATGFSALPAGYYYSDYRYSTELGYSTCFWSTNHTPVGIMVNCRELYQTHGDMTCANKKDSYGYSVRCLRD